MKIDLHTHCLPVSLCAHNISEDLPSIFKEKGIDAIVLTNHCYPSHCNNLSNDLKEQAKLYVDAYLRCKRSGDMIGFKVFFGVEIKLINEPNSPEFLLYGISEEDFIESYPLYEKTQSELFEYCNEKDILMVQAHPFRIEQGYKPADMKYMHGIEIYNSHYLFENKFDSSLCLAKENRKLVTAGSDFHRVEMAGTASVVIPDEIENQFELRDYLKTGKITILSEGFILYTNEGGKI